MNRQLALKLVSKMQTNVWDLTDKQAEIILSVLENPKQQLSICDVGSSLIVNIKSFGEFIHKLCETDFTKRKKQYKYKDNWYGFVELKDIYRREFLN